MSRSLTIGLGIAGVLAALVGIGEYYRNNIQTVSDGNSTVDKNESLKSVRSSKYDVHGYSTDGLDMSGHTRDYYRCKMLELDQFVIMRAAELAKSRGALAARQTLQRGIEKCIRMILGHLYGKGFEDRSLADLLSVCERKKVFDQSFMSRLYQAVEYLTAERYANLSEANIQMRYCYLVLKELVEKYITIVDIGFSSKK